MHLNDKVTHKSLEDKAHSIYSLAASGQTDKLLAELNSINPKQLSKLAAELNQESLKKGSELPQVKVTQMANTKEGGSRQPIQLSFESKSNKAERAQVFSYDVLKHKWYHSELDTRARAIELYTLDGKPAKVIHTLNTVKPKDFSELERKLNEQTSQFTLDSQSLPPVEVTNRGILGGVQQPIELSIDNKSNYRAHVYQYDFLKHKWAENTNLSSQRSLHRLFSNWQFQVSETKRTFSEIGPKTRDAADWSYRFFIKMEGVTKGLEDLSGGKRK